MTRNVTIHTADGTQLVLKLQERVRIDIGDDICGEGVLVSLCLTPGQSEDELVIRLLHPYVEGARP
jgi:hypothetical protein